MDLIWLCSVLAIVEVFLLLVKTPGSGWLKLESPDRLDFGPPLIDRVRGVLGALAAVGLAADSLRHASHFSVWLVWFVFVPGIVLMSGACLWFAAPREVSFNLVQRTYRGGTGLPLFSKSLTGALTEASVIYAYGSRNYNSVVLWAAGVDGPKLLLAQAKSREEAIDFAQKVGGLAQIEVQETTTQAMRDQILACKRS